MIRTRVSSASDLNMVVRIFMAGYISAQADIGKCFFTTSSCRQRYNTDLLNVAVISWPINRIN